MWAGNFQFLYIIVWKQFCVSIRVRDALNRNWRKHSCVGWKFSIFIHHCLETILRIHKGQGCTEQKLEEAQLFGLEIL